MKILVTGGSGYIGSVLIHYLLKEHEVYVLDKFEKNNPSLAFFCSNKNFHIIKGDVRDEKILKSILNRVEMIIPLAALVGAPLCKQDPINAKSTNFDAIKLIVDNISTEQKIIFPTTNSGYGISKNDELCTEDSPLNPISLYGKSKCEAEDLILQSGNGITFRLATVFGMSPQMRLDLIVNDFVYRAMFDSALIIFEGSFRRNFIHIRDVSRAFVHAIDNYERMNNEPFNVGLSSANLTKLELCKKIKEHLPNFTFIESKIGEDPDKRDYLVSNEKIESTGFKPSFSLDDGIKELIKGYASFKTSLFSNV
jgi:nucleoside-diphosphate-sugar epimerase